MINKCGYSFGPDLPFHYEERLDGWAVFDARNDKDHGTGMKQWEANKLAHELNGSPKPDLATIDATP